MNSNVINILNAQIDVDRYEDGKHEDSFWYGDTVATIKTPSKNYGIAARGIVICSLIAKKDFIGSDGKSYKRGEEIAYVKDKNEAGRFMDEMSPYIKNDEELNEILSGDHKLYELEIENNNWFSLEFLDSKNNFIDDFVMDSCELKDVIDEAKEYIIEENKNNIIYGIYNRVASNDNAEFVLEAQKNKCLYALNNTISTNTDVIKLYIDVAPSTDKLPPSLESLLQDIKDKKIKIVFTPSLSRLSRDTIQILKIRDILKENNADIFIVDQNKYLYKDILKSNIIIENIEDLSKKNIEKDNHDEIEY